MRRHRHLLDRSGLSGLVDPLASPNRSKGAGAVETRRRGHFRAVGRREWPSDLEKQRISTPKTKKARPKPRLPVEPDGGADQPFAFLSAL
jgi:hypothetical protein